MLNRKGARTDPCGTPFLRRRNLLLWPFPVVRVKLRLLTISMIIWSMCMSCSNRSSLQVRPLKALIKPDWSVLLFCFACLYHSLEVVQPSWIAEPCPTTKLSLLISKSFVGIKQGVVRVALKTFLKTRLGICIYKTSLPHLPDDYVGFTSRCPPHILQQNCAHR